MLWSYNQGPSTITSPWPHKSHIAVRLSSWRLPWKIRKLITREFLKTITWWHPIHPARVTTMEKINLMTMRSRLKTLRRDSEIWRLLCSSIHRHRGSGRESQVLTCRSLTVSGWYKIISIALRCFQRMTYVDQSRPWCLAHRFQRPRDRVMFWQNSQLLKEDKIWYRVTTSERLT